MTERYYCHHCGGRGTRTGLGGRPLRRIWWYCPKCYGTGTLIFSERFVVAVGVRRADPPSGDWDAEVRP